MIYIVEDDAGIRDMMIYTLNSTGFEALGFPDAALFWTAMKKDLPELVLLDIMLPGEDGIAILGKLRQSSVTQAIPVIMATAKGTEYDRVTGLDGGADDYLCKPFGMMEMVSRIRAVLRRAAPRSSAQELRIGALVMNHGDHQVSIRGSSVALTLKEYEMLRLFMENPGHVFTRDDLLSKIWDMDYDGETRTIDVHIRSLRTKLGACGDYIETVRGVGYRMRVREV